MRRRAKKPPRFRPGGVDSWKLGCTCPHLLNRWGHGYHHWGKLNFYVEDDCPMHGGGKWKGPEDDFSLYGYAR